MAIQLKKGQKIDLTKGNPGLKHIRLGLGWDTNMFDGGDDFDLDVSLFMVGKSGKVADCINKSNHFFIPFTPKCIPSGSYPPFAKTLLASIYVTPFLLHRFFIS